MFLPPIVCVSVCVSPWLSELKMSMHTMTIKPCATKTRFAHGLVWLHFRMGVKDLQSTTRSKVCPLALMSRRVGTQYSTGLPTFDGIQFFQNQRYHLSSGLRRRILEPHQLGVCSPSTGLLSLYIELPATPSTRPLSSSLKAALLLQRSSVSDWKHLKTIARKLVKCMWKPKVKPRVKRPQSVTLLVTSVWTEIYISVYICEMSERFNWHWTAAPVLSKTIAPCSVRLRRLASGQEVGSEPIHIHESRIIRIIRIICQKCLPWTAPNHCASQATAVIVANLCISSWSSLGIEPGKSTHSCWPQDWPNAKQTPRHFGYGTSQTVDLMDPHGLD